MITDKLMVGNWIANRGVYLQYTIALGSDLSRFDPIPLTPEILEKCGFTGREDSDWHEKLYVLGDLTFSLNGYFIFTSAYGCYTEIGSIKSLHQLQNLHYALTGEELNIEL